MSIRHTRYVGYRYCQINNSIEWQWKEKYGRVIRTKLYGMRRFKYSSGLFPKGKWKSRFKLDQYTLYWRIHK